MTKFNNWSTQHSFISSLIFLNKLYLPLEKQRSDDDECKKSTVLLLIPLPPYSRHNAEAQPAVGKRSLELTIETFVLGPS